jgi:glycosyltransferase involved in cell wall biosynthesis
MSEPRASAIVCVYNRPEDVRTCLESLLAMEGEGFEIIVVDDGSTDETPAVLDRIESEHADAALTIVRHERNLGLSAARNTGIETARGRVIAFTDSDCVVDPGWLAALADHLEGDDLAGAGGAIREPAAANAAERAYAGTTSVDRGRRGRALVGCNMAFRRDALGSHRFDAALQYYCDEDELVWRLGREGLVFGFAPGAVVEHRHHQTLRTYLRQAWRQGRGSARFWFKRGTWVGPDVAFALLALITLPLGLWRTWLLAVPAASAALHVAALLYNEARLKGKSPGRAIADLPMAVAYSIVKAVSVAWFWVRLLAGRERAIIESKRRWRASR